MRFFEHQDQARSRTTLLLCLFALAVLAIGGLAGWATHFLLTVERPPEDPRPDHYWSLVLGVPSAVWTLIVLSSALKLLSLRNGGGAHVAEQLGGTLLSSPTRDPLERRLLNVVEEMAIASGLPVPPVYLLRNESGINAFAAGWAQGDAVLGITQGALEGLSREQLQGVVAHEFSHILNRDSALNMRMFGILHGIVSFATLGRILMRLGGVGQHGTRGRNKGIVHFLILGGGIWLLGSVGALIARLIQSAVSQQREFLADASAVQFTRNPRGIGGALATIGTRTSVMAAPASREVSPMLIGSPGTFNLSGLDSHPPLFERIRRVLPDWDGNFDALATEPGSQRRRFQSPLHGTGAEKDGDELSESLILEAVTDPLSLGILAGSTGQPPTPGTLSPRERAQGSASSAPREASPRPSDAPAKHGLPEAAALLHATPTRLRQAAEEPYSARALIFAWILDQAPEARATQLMLLGRDPALAHEAEALAQELPLPDQRMRLPLFDIALGTLAQLSSRQKHEFAELVEAVAAQLSQRSYLSFCLASLTLRHIQPPHARPMHSRMLVKTALETALGVLASEGHDSEEQIDAAFAAGRAELGARGHLLQRPPATELGVSELRAALDTLVTLPLRTRQNLLSAAERSAAYDGTLRPSEEQLLRTLSVYLEVARSPLES